MNSQSPVPARDVRRPRNKATMDEPQEEFIEACSSRFECDREHGDELRHATHTNRWEDGAI
jgi:hypothetical protein